MFEDILARKKKAILGKWLDLIVDTYPAGSKLLTEKDQFTNPVGYIIASETEIIYDELLQNRSDSEQMIIALDNILKSRAIQDFTPGEAVGFIFLLKKAIRSELKSVNDLEVIDDRIDMIACQAINVYTSCKEKINDIRVNEIRRDRDNAFRLLDRMTKKRSKLEDTMSSSYNGSEVM